MALTGSTEMFSLPDIMRFLGTTRKTGCLRLVSPVGSGSIFIDQGSISALETSATLPSIPIPEKMFALLRMGDGDFSFQADETTTSTSTIAIEPLLDQVARLIEQWPAISKIIPSMDATIRLMPKLSSASVTLCAEQWEFIAVIGNGVSARALGAHLSMGEFSISRVVKELHEIGVVSVSAAAITPAVAVAPVAVVAPVATEPMDRAPAPASAPARTREQSQLEKIAAAASAAMTSTVGAPADSVSFDPAAKPVEELIKDPWGAKPPVLSAGSVQESDEGTQINRSRFFKLLQNAKQ